MFALERGMRLFVCTQPVDMRKGMYTLYGMVLSGTSIDPLGGDVFVWFNKGRKSCKILRWYGDSYLLYHRRLSRGTYEVPWMDGSTGYVQVPWESFALVMEGVSLASARRRGRDRK